MEQAVTVLDEPGHLKMNVNELAAALCTDRITLYHAFREVFHTTPSEYIIARRIEAAKRLLLEYPEWTLPQIAASAGFNNEKYFIRAFKFTVGCTPGKFRSGSRKWPGA
jgi:AraC-like DNA-binding protein